MRSFLGLTVSLAAVWAELATAQSVPKIASVDTPSTTAAGAAFMMPKGWSSMPTGPAIVLAPPESNLHIAILDVGASADAKTAAAKAWAAYQPAAHRPIAYVAPQAPTEGWDERQTLNYETSPNEHAVVEALTFRSGASWTVAIIDGSIATFEKRGSAAVLVIQSLRPSGFKRESFLGREPRALDAARITALSTFLQTSMQTLRIPGVAFALTEHGKVVFEGGMGVREIGKPQLVDAHTRFMIASNTKSLTTLMLAELVDQGKLVWDEPVTSVYPSFRLGSDATTRKVMIRHLVCACTGLPRKDLVYAFKNTRYTPAISIFDALATSEPTSAFGEAFQYNNLMGSAAGYIAAHVVHPELELGAAYDATMRTYVFDPLGMKDTTLDIDSALAADHASPHAITYGESIGVVNMDINFGMMPVRPTGGAWSSAHDMIKYVQLELARGKLPSGKRLVSEKNLLVRRQPNVAIGEDGFYGMGLSGTKIGGVVALQHGGSLPGFMSNFYVIPDADVGAVLLTNADSGQLLLTPFLRRLFEILYDGKAEAAQVVTAAAAGQEGFMSKLRADVTLPPAPELAADLAESYVCPDIGPLRVRTQDGRVSFVFPFGALQVGSKHNADGSVSYVTTDPGMAGLEFVAGKRDGVRDLVIRDGQHEYVYVETH